MTTEELLQRLRELSEELLNYHYGNSENPAYAEGFESGKRSAGESLAEILETFQKSA